LIYEAGTVTVLRGVVSVWIPDPLAKSALPTVATQVVPEGGEYRFILPPGPYVLVGDDGGTDTINGIPWVPWTSVSVAAGQTISTDIPPSCI
jgi:hypothetical protein